MSEPRHPELRASDADRERVADVLRHAAGDGQLTMDELDERLGETYAALTRGDLETLTADLQPAGDVQPAGGFVVRRGEGGARWLLAILGGCDRRGRWRIAERCTVVNVMGGSDLDLNHVELAADRVQLRVFSFMGGADIRVPDGLNVVVSQFAFMGGNDVDIGEGRPPAAGPVLHLRLFAFMGGNDVRRGPRRSRRDR
ncbi:MAG: hypothetical protein QOD69_3436, partial [Solirubrobacteraceae bacterium]|nr:hypothetical protein [Solirubrobacteraceae bacterium]